MISQQPPRAPEKYNSDDEAVDLLVQELSHQQFKSHQQSTKKKKRRLQSNSQLPAIATKKLSRDEQKALQIQRMFEKQEKQDNKRKKVKGAHSHSISHPSLGLSTHEQSSTASLTQPKENEQASLSDLLVKDIELTKDYDMKGFDNLFFFLAEYQSEEKARLLRHTSGIADVPPAAALLPSAPSDDLLRCRNMSQHLNAKWLENKESQQECSLAEFLDQYMSACQVVPELDMSPAQP